MRNVKKREAGKMVATGADRGVSGCFVKTTTINRRRASVRVIFRR
jgi:hypothetical protein